MRRAFAIGTLCSASAAVAVLSVAAPVRAELRVSTQISTRQIEVGEELTVQLSVMSDGDLGSPTSTRLTGPPGLSVRGPRVGSQSQVSIVNGRMTRSTGVNLTWGVSANRPGTYRLGPPTADFGGERAQGQVITIEVVPAGTRQRPNRGFPFPFDPFDPFGQMGGRPRLPGFPFDPDAEEPAAPQVPPEYQLEHAPDPIAFLIAKAAPKEVVLGQAVTFKAYTYGSRGGYEGVDVSEPGRDGFLAYPVEMPPQMNAVVVPLDNTNFFARQVSEMVLFPIRTGTLRIGAMRFGFGGRGYPATPGAPGLIRQSNPIDIRVVEPPVAGRPAGYRLGDVGNYTLTAQVDPRKIKQGDSIAVVAKLEGTGNLPSKLALPQQNGVEFADPTSIDKISAENGRVHGSRVFTYVVRVDAPGSVDLGELRLPYYNADKRRYEIAKASLGRIDVEAGDKGKAPSAVQALPEDRLKSLLTPRTELGSAREASYLSDRPFFWAWLLAGPGLIVGGTGLSRLARRARERLRQQQSTPERLALRELELLNTAVKNGDVALVGAGVERAVHFAIEGVTLLKSRGVLRSELARELERRSVASDLAASVVSLLEATEAARFVREASPSEAAELHTQGFAVVRRLTALGRRKSAEPSGSPTA